MTSLKKFKRKALEPILAGSIGNESGLALLAAILLMLALSGLGLTIVFLSSTDVKITRNTTFSSQAFMVAESGAADAINQLRADPTWGAGGAGTVPLGGHDGTYQVTVYDNVGVNGRTLNTDPGHVPTYVTLGASDILLEATGTVGGISRSIGLVVRPTIGALGFAVYSDGDIDATGAGNNPGKVTGKIYGKDSIGFQGNYDLSLAEAESNNGSINPSCPSNAFKSCNKSAESIAAPVLDFSYYQDQDNFSDQQVYIMTPTLGATTDCDAADPCDRTWKLFYAIQTQLPDGTEVSYTLTARVDATDDAGPNWTHRVNWCTPNTADLTDLWEGDRGVDCTIDNSVPQWYTFVSDDIENDKPFVNGTQFNAYTAAANPPYTLNSSIVNVFDATGHLEFLGPPASAATGSAPFAVEIRSTILVGTSATSTPTGKIDFEGGAGALTLIPDNGIAIVAEKVEFKSKYSDVDVTVGLPGKGALIIATNELEIKAENNNNMNFTLNGSAVVGGAATDDPNLFTVSGPGTRVDISYVDVGVSLDGWSDYGTLIVNRREWREL